MGIGRQRRKGVASAILAIIQRPIQTRWRVLKVRPQGAVLATSKVQEGGLGHMPDRWLSEWRRRCHRGVGQSGCQLGPQRSTTGEHAGQNGDRNRMHLTEMQAMRRTSLRTHRLFRKPKFRRNCARPRGVGGRAKASRREPRAADCCGRMCQGVSPKPECSWR